MGFRIKGGSGCHAFLLFLKKKNCGVVVFVFMTLQRIDRKGEVGDEGEEVQEGASGLW